METAVERQACIFKCGHPPRLSLAALIVAAIVLGACTHIAPEPTESRLPAPEAPPTPTRVAPPPKTAVDRLSVPEEDLHIVVSKAERLLTVYQDREAIRRYRVGLGFRPQGHKRWEGDGRTPEGSYSIALKNPHSRYFLSLGLNYPTMIDAWRGYVEGRIIWEEYLEIKRAFDEGEVPPWDTPLGGEIFIHGHGAARDWTKGCIALDDDDMRELYSLVGVGTPVTIVP